MGPFVGGPYFDASFTPRRFPHLRGRTWGHQKGSPWDMSTWVRLLGGLTCVFFKNILLVVDSEAERGGGF